MTALPHAHPSAPCAATLPEFETMPTSPEAFDLLRATCEHLEFPPHDIAQNLDPRGHYRVDLDRSFPFTIKLFHYSSRTHTPGQTWHEQLELFIPLDGPVRFRMGETEIPLERGHLLVVDNLKVHHVVDFPGFDTRAIVISFLPEFVHGLGSPSCDYTFLLPFYSNSEKKPHLVALNHQVSPAICDAVRRLVACYFSSDDAPLSRAGCKAYLLELLYHLARHFQVSETVHWKLVRQQQLSARLKKLFERIDTQFAEKLTLTEAARLVSMNGPQFMRAFKQVTGTTLIAYLNQVRLAKAVPLLKGSDCTIAEIANHVGFSDQSYFDRRFKRVFGQSPKEFRLMARRSSTRAGEDHLASEPVSSGQLLAGPGTISPGLASSDFRKL
jgi:AraC-like DNA-binding protein